MKVLGLKWSGPARLEHGFLFVTHPSVMDRVLGIVYQTLATHQSGLTLTPQLSLGQAAGMMALILLPTPST